jgi:hypothetical protein
MKRDVVKLRLVRKILLIIIFLVGVIVSALSSLGLTSSFTKEFSKVDISKGSFTSSVVCGRCHSDIYDHWRNSLHARAVSDPIFQTAYFEIYTTSAGEAKYLCLKCHSPTTQITRDFDLRQGISNEGITCDYCHSVKALSSGEGEYPFVVEPGPIKWGPWESSTGRAHKTAYSPLFESASFCSGCHEFVNQHGLPVLETYSEWKQSPYAREGITCQKCHMPRVKGRVVATKMEGRLRPYVNLHKLAGKSSVGQLQKAISVEIESIERHGENLVVTVSLTNQGAGHMVPTGLPGRAIVLDTIVRIGGKQELSRKQVYQRILLDDKGNEIKKVAKFFLDARAIAQDNRIAPKEVRTERFSFNVPPGDPVEVAAKVYYLYEPFLVEKKQIQVEIITKEKVGPLGR